MKTLPLSEVKAKLSGLVEQVGNTDEEIVITKNGRPAAILVSPDEFKLEGNGCDSQQRLSHERDQSQCGCF